MWREVKRLLDQHSNFLLTTHAHPDGDGIGSACAFSELLINKGKNVRFVCDSPLPSKFRFLDYHGFFEQYSPSSDYNDVEVVIVLDAHKRNRIGDVAKLCDNPGRITVSVDHHHARVLEMDHNVIDPQACSVGAMVYTLYKECGFPLNLRAATGIYTSILCDTGRFSYTSTTRKAHKIADECIKLGVDPDLIYSRLFQQLSFKQLRVFALALNNMQLHHHDTVLIQTLSYHKCQELGISPEELEDLDLDYILEFDKLVDEIACIVLLREISPDTVRLSVRSKAGIDVEPFIRKLGGGGHRCAAGALLHASVEEVKEMVLTGLQTAGVHSSTSML